MKNILKFLFAFAIGFLVISCEKDEDRATVGTASSSSLTSNVSTIVLTKVNAAQNAITFTWVNPSYGINLAENNQLQFALKGTSFAAPKTVSVTAGTTSVTYNVQDFNALMLSLGLPVNSVSLIEVRLKSTLASLDGSATNLPVVYSTALQLSVNPYALISYMYAPGAYQGWVLATANTLVSGTSNGIYIGYINFTAGNLGFKVTADQSWTTGYGSNTQFSSTVNTIPISTTGGDMTAPGTGHYQVTVNMNTMTIKLIPYQVSIIGSATPGGDWSTDIDMTWNNATQQWTASSVTLLAGQFKFRLNHDWPISWGGSGGVLSTGGGNIDVTAGVHTVTSNTDNLVYNIQ